MRELTGIQTRVDRKGVERYRGYVKDRGKKVFGPWTTSLADARGWRIRAMAAKLDGPLTQTDGQRLADAAERFLTGIEQGVILSRKDIPYAASTARGYRYAFRDFILPELGHIPVERLRRSQVQRWIDALSLELGAGSTRNAFHALAALYSWLLPRHDDMTSPTDGVKIPRPGKHRERFAKPEEMLRLLEALPKDLALPYALAFYAGLRRGEIRALRAEDVERDWIHVRRSLDPVAGFTLPKNGRERAVPIFDALRPYLAAAPSEGLLVPCVTPAKFGARDLSHWKEVCAPYWEAAGLTPIGLHEGRHSYATALVRAGYDISDVSEWVGHGNAATTLTVYVKPSGREDLDADRMNVYLRGAAEGATVE